MSSFSCPCCEREMETYYQPKQRRLDGVFVDVSGVHMHTCRNEDCQLHDVTLDADALQNEDVLSRYGGAA